MGVDMAKECGIKAFNKKQRTYLDYHRTHIYKREEWNPTI